MKGIILHGNKLLPDGSLSLDMKNRIAAMLNLINNDSFDLVIVTGGKTRKGFVSEAEAILDDIQNIISTQILLEDKSRTTYENIKYLKDYLDTNICDEYIVITSKNSLRRFKYLYKKHLPEYFGKIRFVTANNENNLKTFIYECLLYVWQLFDPNEKLARPFVRFFRS